jgi:DNA-cytosine methyltransferase
MNVLSLFDGISCARVALDRANLPVKTYFACEIDPHAIAISTKNYPDSVRLGDVREVSHLPEPIDLLIGGSPCQDLSIAKKDRKGLSGDRSGLFWEYVRIRDLLRPRAFILENVASMPKADRDIITEAMGVEPILINASLVSAQCRKRLFWTNLPVTLPADRGICLRDILQPESEVDASMEVKSSAFTATAQTGRNETKKMGYVANKDHQANRVYDETGKLPALASVCNSLVKLGHMGNGDSQGNRVYSTDGKSVTLSANGGGLGAKTGLYAISYVGHLEGGLRGGMEGQEHLSRAHRQTHRVYGDDGKAPTLAASETSGRVHVAVGQDTQTHRIRKLTPVECERLQGLPDEYTAGVAKTHRYKALGNAFNVDVIAHILKSYS